MRTIITGSAGFIGFHLTKYLLQKGYEVIGIDNFNSYYDTSLKYARNDELQKISLEAKGKFILKNCDIEDYENLLTIFSEYRPLNVIHLAAQAGVRYSIKNPKAYIQSNLVGFSNILECCKNFNVKHLIYASSSSVYGMNSKQPFSSDDNTDFPISLYAATKKSNELLAFSYSHLFKIPSTGLRFFTVYGPFGRPDMAYFKFTKNILKGKKIDIYNKGKMYRDYTYIDDIINGIYKLIKKPPSLNSKKKFKNDSLSAVAPFRVLNIGNTKKVYLLDFINTLEKELDKKIKKNYMPMQKGDVHSTLSDSSLLKRITGYNPKTNYKIGITKFIKWYLNYYH